MFYEKSSIILLEIYIEYNEIKCGVNTAGATEILKGAIVKRLRVL